MNFRQTVVWALVAGVFAYYAYNPLPANVEQPLLYSAVTSIFRIIEDMGKVSEILGYKEVLVFRRDAMGWIATSLSPPLSSYTGVIIEDTIFDGVPVRIYKPAVAVMGDNEVGDNGVSPAFVYVHGGGFVLGSVDFCNDFLVRIVRATRVTVVAIEYRLAPEHPRPAALHDCEAASRYLFANAAKLGVDPRRVGIGGESAGGNMAAVLSLKFRDEGSNPQFAYQALIYPWLQAMDFNLPSFLQNEAYNRPDMRQHGLALYALAYLDLPRAEAAKLRRNEHVTAPTRARYQARLDPGTARLDPGLPRQDIWVDGKLATLMEPSLTDPYTFPLMADSVGRVPAALVLTMGLDPLRDEGQLYVKRLRSAAVPTQHYHDEDCWHGAINFVDGPFRFECGVRLLEEVIRYIAEANELSD